MKVKLGALILALSITGAGAQQLAPPIGFDAVPRTLTPDQVKQVHDITLKEAPGLAGNDGRGPAIMKAWPRANKDGFIACATFPSSTYKGNVLPQTTVAFLISTGPFPDIKTRNIANEDQYNVLCRTSQGTDVLFLHTDTPP